jgi:hypothetical protein
MQHLAVFILFHTGLLYMFRLLFTPIIRSGALHYSARYHGPLLSVACPALQYFSILSHKRYGFRKKITEQKVCVLIFCTTLSPVYLILGRNEQDMIKNV